MWQPVSFGRAAMPVFAGRRGSNDRPTDGEKEAQSAWATKGKYTGPSLTGSSAPAFRTRPATPSARDQSPPIVLLGNDVADIAAQLQKKYKGLNEKTARSLALDHLQGTAVTPQMVQAAIERSKAKR